LCEEKKECGQVMMTVEHDIVSRSMLARERYDVI